MLKLLLYGFSIQSRFERAGQATKEKIVHKLLEYRATHSVIGSEKLVRKKDNLDQQISVYLCAV